MNDTIILGMTPTKTNWGLGGPGDGKVSASNPTGFYLALKDRATPTVLEMAKALPLTTSSGYKVPDRYLVKMTRAQINQFSYLYFHKLVNYDNACLKKDGIPLNNCVLVSLGMALIENANLAFVNGYGTWEYVQFVYKETEKMIRELPSPFPGFKEQLTNAAKFVVGAVVGVITAGPVGLFTGAAAAVKDVINKERLKKEMQAAEFTQQQFNVTNQAVQAKEIMTTQKTIKYVAIGVGGLLAVGAIIWLVNRN